MRERASGAHTQHTRKTFSLKWQSAYGSQCCGLHKRGMDMCIHLGVHFFHRAQSESVTVLQNQVTTQMVHPLQTRAPKFPRRLLSPPTLRPLNTMAPPKTQNPHATPNTTTPPPTPKIKSATPNTTRPAPPPPPQKHRAPPPPYGDV